MYIKKVDLSCGVKNCRNKESYMISKSKEAGATVIICGECIKEAYEKIFAKAEEKPKKTTVRKSAKKQTDARSV